MEEGVEGFLSKASDISVRARSIIHSDEMDFSTKQSHLLADMLNAASLEDNNQSIFFRWYYEICAWIPLKFVVTNNNKIIPTLTKRDDRLTGLACYAAFMSVQKVLVDNFSKMFYYNTSDTRITVKTIQEEVLNSFDILCEDLLIEKSWDVVSIRECIMKAADFAVDYINFSQAKKLCFPGKDSHRDLLLWIFQGYLIGNFEQDDEFLLKKNASTNFMDDDTVGLSRDIQKIKDRLTRSYSKLDIIPIIGMGGIGKTTLVRKVYKDPQIMTFFHIRAWIVVSREFHERDVLLGLLDSIAPLPNEVYNEDTEQLPERLYRRLKGWRYFIVLDDIWTKEAWDRIKFCFPDDNNGSRIILTSRITEVASHVEHENPPHSMSFLGIEDSWKLLQKRVYGKEVCPHQLTNLGMQIAEKCQGLPLAIEVMAGHLSNINKTPECWEDVAKRVGFPTEVTHLESLSKILFISFDELPHQLKTCFLSMTLFPKNYEISVRKLIQMWTAMEFLGQNLSDSAKDVTLEQLAMTYFKSLTDRSLIMVKEKKYNGTTKLCGVHDLLWDLSTREFCKQFSCDDGQNHVISNYRTLLYFGYSFGSDYSINFEGFKLLRVLDIINETFDHFPIDVTNLGNLRYLALSTSDNIPPLIYKLSYLETLLNYHERANQILPREIWLLVHLKHLRVGTCTFLCEPPKVCVEGSSNSLLPCLLSLSNLSISSCKKETFLNIPHLKQLGIVEHVQDEVGDEYEQDDVGDEYEQDDVGDELLCSALESIVNLHQLEKFKLCCSFKVIRQRCIPDLCSFLPNTIKKLTLSRSYLPWSKMKTLATLPTLEVLKLKDNAFQGEEWVMDDEEFVNLKYLMLEGMDLISWKANSDNFPNLQHLVINFCVTLCGIPREFGEINTLALIDLNYVNSVIYVSAIEIERDQMSLGNDKFKLLLGRAPPQFHTTGYLLFFVWYTMRLNMCEEEKEK